MTRNIEIVFVIVLTITAIYIPTYTFGIYIANEYETLDNNEKCNIEKYQNFLINPILWILIDSGFHITIVFALWLNCFIVYFKQINGYQAKIIICKVLYPFFIVSTIWEIIGIAIITEMGKSCVLIYYYSVFMIVIGLFSSIIHAAIHKSESGEHFVI